MSDIDAILDDLAESYYPEHEYNDIYVNINNELKANAKQEIYKLFIEVIGKTTSQEESAVYQFRRGFNACHSEQIERLAKLFKLEEEA